VSDVSALDLESGLLASTPHCVVLRAFQAFERQWLAFAELARGGAAPRAGIAEGRADVVACQAAAALLAARKGIIVGGEAAGGGA